MRKQTGRSDYALQGDDDSIFLTCGRTASSDAAAGGGAAHGNRLVRWISRLGSFVHERPDSAAVRQGISRPR